MQGMGDWLNSRRHFSAGLLPLITAVSLLLIFPAVTLGAALTWVGTGADADFMTAGNWSPAQQPTASDSCTINSTSNLQPSILTNATCGCACKGACHL